MWLNKQELTIQVKENNIKHIKTIAWPKYELHLAYGNRPDVEVEHRISEEKYQVETIRYSQVATERLYQDSYISKQELDRMIKRKQEDGILQQAKSFIEYKTLPCDVRPYGEEIQQAELKVLRRI